MSEKSELSYLLEALDAARDGASDELRGYVERAIERREQDLAKADAALLYTNREKLYMDTPQNVPNTVDNTPKGGGDVPQTGVFWYCGCRGRKERVTYADDADAARAELKEAVGRLDSISLWLLHRFGPDSPEGNETKHIRAFLDRVGKQPKVGP